MSVIPPELPDVGATSQRLRQNPAFDPLKAGFGTEEYFVWSRFDGATSLKDLILMTGLAVERAIAIVRALRAAGAILLPGEAAPPAALSAGARPTSPPPTSPRPSAGAAATRVTQPMPVAAPPVASRTRTTAPMPTVAAPPIPSADGLAVGTAPAQALTETLPVPALEQPTAAERAAMAEPGDLSLDEKTRVLAGLRLVAAGDPWALVGVAAGADKRAIKRAFFERSKLYHPDRFYGRDLGAWRGRLHAVFEAISAAHGQLVENRAARGTAAPVDAAASEPQSPAEYAAELFERACQAEVSGDLAAAGRLFAAAVKLEPSSRYLRRAAHCALAAGEPRTALAYANKVAAAEPTDPSTARILARALRAVDRADDAEEVLVMALAMKNDNDTLAAELASDLASVRAALRR